jgi:hypothetical protein
MSVQAIHAGIQFQHEHPEFAQHWYSKSNYLGFLSVSNELELNQLIQKLENSDIKFSVFREPDIESQITAIAIAPGNKSKKLCSNLKLALKEHEEIK